ncbi:MAG TPA: tyrosine-type recombinase/integrase [Steroidobacteraceae bacterium]|nr:tyrosine-type recombinase/integrase [Steroidobacteraceae bacterium]
MEKVETIAAVCRAYISERRRSRSAACAHDAQQRFERTVYGTPFGRLRLATLKAPALREWRDRLRGRGGRPLAAAAANRTLTALKAALNFAIYEGHAAPGLTSELRRVKPLPGGKQRRDLYLDLEQRRALLGIATGAVRDLMEGVALTGARAGELVGACVSQFDARTQAMTFRGKTGERTVPLSPAAVVLFERLAGGRASQARLFVRDDGRPWAHSGWDHRVRDAARAAGLPAEPGAGTCLYTLRHSFITEALLGGLSTLEVARLVGTSVMMIEKHYGHLAGDAARRRLAAVAML